MSAQHDALILDYVNAFQAANTMNEVPRITYNRGWFMFRTARQHPRRYRWKEVEAMKDRLRECVRNAAEAASTAKALDTVERDF